MGGTKEGARKALQTIRDRYGVDEEGRSLKFIEIGRTGGKAVRKKPSGFAYFKANGQLDKVREAGRRGGTKSRRRSKDDGRK